MAEQTRQVMVHVNGQHASQDTGEKDQLGGGYPGQCRRIDDTWYVQYEEPATEESGSAKVLLKVRQDSLEVSRRGETAMQLLLQPGQRTPGKYISQFGQIPLYVITQSVSLQTEDPFAGLHLHIEAEYQLEMDGAIVSQAHLDVIVTDAV